VVKVPPTEIYHDALQVGFAPDAARTLTAIAGATSSYVPDSIGLAPTDPSSPMGAPYGLFGITPVKMDTGTGGDRDAGALAAGTLNQVQAAYDLSHGGVDFTPWTEFTNGAYQDYTATAAAAATATPDPLPTWGPAWAPWNWPSDVGNAGATIWGDLLGKLRDVGLEMFAVGLGIALIGVGVVQTAKSSRRTVK
jgi:hypothetical protein